MLFSQNLIHGIRQCMLKSRHCFVEIINYTIKMSTHSYTAIICTRSRGSFCCTLLACQRIKKNTEWFLKASLGKPDCLHTPLCWCKSMGKRQGGKLVFCDILHFLLLPALLVETQRADVYMQQVEAEVWEVPAVLHYLLDVCFKSLHHQFHSQTIQFLSETAWIVSVHTSVIKERE